MLITNVAIEPMMGDLVPLGYIRCREGRIEALGPMEACPAPEPGEPCHDLPGCTAYPGFIDAHSHLGLFGDGLGVEGEDGNEMSDPVSPQLWALDGINPCDRGFAEALAAGVTTVAVGPGSANAIAGQVCLLKTWGDCVDDMVRIQPLAMKFALGENPKGVYGPRPQSPGTRMATASLIRDQLHKALRYQQDLQRAQEDDEVDPPELDSRCEALLPVLEGRIQAHFHAHRADDIGTALRLTREFGLKTVIIHGTEGYRIAPLLARAGVPVVTGPIIGSRSKPELANMTLENTALLLQAGVPTAICTDHPEVPADLLPVSAALAMRGGCTRQQALRAITCGAARVLGIEDRAGALAPGMWGDIAVFAEDPLSACARPRAVFVDGVRRV